MPRVPGGFGPHSPTGVRRPSRVVSLADARNPEAGNVDEGLGLSVTAPGGALQPWDYRPPSDGMNPLQALEWLGREGIREPLSTALTYASLAEGAGDTGLGGWFDRDRWGQAHGIAQDRSVGQALALAILSSKDDDITDPAWLAEAQDTGAYKRASTATDLAFRVFADPFGVLGGQTMRALIHRGGPAAAGAVTGAAARGRFGLQGQDRFIGPVAAPGGRGRQVDLFGRHAGDTGSRYPAFDTDAYVSAIRGGRESVPAVRATETVASRLRTDREAYWQGIIRRRERLTADGFPVIDDGIDVVYKSADEVGASTVDDLMAEFDGIFRSDEWLQTPVATRMEGGVFAGTGAEGKTLEEIGRMVGASRDPSGIFYSDRAGLKTFLTEAEQAKIWPTVSRSYADEAVDNILTHRSDGDTIRLRELFGYPEQGDAAMAVREFVDRGLSQTNAGGSGLDDWYHAFGGEQKVRDVQKLIVADLRAITRKWVDEADLPERVSVMRSQTPGQAIGPSATTDPLKFKTGAMPGVGGANAQWFESVLDPRKDIDWFMNARRGTFGAFAEEEVLVHPLTLFENAVGGLQPKPGSGLFGLRMGKLRDEIDEGLAATRGVADAESGLPVAPTMMPGMSRGQLRYGPESKPWLHAAVRLGEKGADIPTAPSQILGPPARKAAEGAHTMINQGRRFRLMEDGWWDLPRAPGGILPDVPPGSAFPADAARKAEWHELIEKIYKGDYTPEEWYRWGTDPLGPTPPGWGMLEGATKNIDELIKAAVRSMPGPTRGGDMTNWAPRYITDFNKRVQDAIGDLLEREKGRLIKPGRQLVLKTDWQDELYRIADAFFRDYLPHQPFL